MPKNVIKNEWIEKRDAERNRLFLFWEDTFNNLTSLKLDVSAVIREIYATYLYFEQDYEHNSVLRFDLGIYGFLNQIIGFNTYPSNCKEYEVDVITHLLRGLAWVIEANFPRRYYLRSLPMEILIHNSPLEADMSSFDSYQRAVHKMMKIYAKENDEYEN